MRDKANELGHSLIFPVICRYCQAPIYLFASPNGGFAIFDSLGNDWPKHQCGGVSLDKSSYVTIRPTFIPDYDWPIPKSTVIRQYSPSSIGGIIIKSNSSSKMPGYCDVELYDGNTICKVISTNILDEGRYYKGIVRAVTGFQVFEKIIEYQCELNSNQIVVANCLDQVLLSNLKSHDIWSLQSDAEILQKCEPGMSNLLGIALDSLLNGYKLSSVVLLTELVKTSSTHIEAKMKARHANTLFRLLEELNLCRAVPRVWQVLSKQTRKLLNPRANRHAADLIKMGCLKIGLELPEKSVDIFRVHIEKESKYIETLKVAAMPQLINELQNMLASTL